MATESAAVCVRCSTWLPLIKTHVTKEFYSVSKCVRTAESFYLDSTRRRSIPLNRYEVDRYGNEFSLMFWFGSDDRQVFHEQHQSDLAFGHLQIADRHTRFVVSTEQSNPRNKILFTRGR